MADRSALLGLAVLTSLTTITAFLLYGAYQKKKQQQQQQLSDKAHKQPQARADPVVPKDLAASHDSPKKPKKEPTPLPQKEPASNGGASVAPAPVAPVAAPAVNVGQDKATAATKKYKEGAFKEAIELYTEAIRLCETSVPVDQRNLKVMFSNRAAAYERLQDYESVIADCTAALVLDKRHPKSYLRRAKAKAALGRHSSALVDYVCLLVISEEKQEQVDDQLALEISRIHTEIVTEQIAEAQEDKKKNVPRYLPDQFFITSYYSSFHPSDDENDIVADKTSVEYTLELNALGDAAESAQKRGELLTKRALAFKKEKEYEKAAKDLETALPLVQLGDNAYYTAQIESGTFYHLRGEFEIAKTCFEHALKAKPQSIFAKIRMGGLCFDQKDMKQALTWFEQALAEKPDCSTAFFHRGQLHSIDIAPDGSNAEEAMTLALNDLERCIELSPDFSMAYIQLGVTHARTGNFEKAVEYLKTATVITPDVPEVYNYLGETYMQLMQMPGSGVDFEAVEAMFEKAIELDPTYPMAYINRGNLLVSKGSEYGHAALDLFQTAVKMCPRSKFAYCHLAQVYMAMQDYSRAIEQIDSAIAYALSGDEFQELFALRITAETHQQAQLLLQ
ncbi:Mitochondrial import receptor subunit tom70, partial [Globisporangium splendens]